MKKLYIFSYGLYPEQITLETLVAMKECGEVYSHCLDSVTAGRFSGYVSKLNLTSGLDFRQTAAAVVSALDRHDTIGFLTYGNPLFLNQAAAGVLAAAEKKGAEVRVISGVSSFDALVTLFGLNKYSAPGLRLVDTASLLDSGAIPAGGIFSPEMDTLFFVPYLLARPEYAGGRRRFIAEAAKAYPSSAPFSLADCASISGREAKVLKGTAGRLGALLSKVNERHTLFVPAAAKTVKKKNRR